MPFKFKFQMMPVLYFALIITCSFFNKAYTQIKSGDMDPKGFVVMELFTSQGCSSCPPADKLLGDYADLNNDHIIPLAFHVDYWNRLGWRDSFSSAKYSSRQRDYAMIIARSSVYTPQLIINGEKEIIGSDESKVATAVGNAIKIKPVVSVNVIKVANNLGELSVQYSLNGMPKNARLQAALVQKLVVTNILKGENRGVKLTNHNVVRDFVSTQLKTNVSVITLNLPQGYSEKDFAVILYVQDDASGKIIGAVKKML